MPVLRKTSSFMVAAALALTSVPLSTVPAAAEYREITCSSNKNRYNTCSVPGVRRVDIVRQLSDSECRYRRSWGVTDDDRIWVDRGCRAVFGVEIAGFRPPRPQPGYPGGYPDPGYPEPGYPDPGTPGGELSGGEALGLFALLAIVGAAAAALDKNDRVPGEPPAVDAAKICKAFAAYDMRDRGADRIRSNVVRDVNRLDRRTFRVDGTVTARFRGDGDRRVPYRCTTRGDRVIAFNVR